MLLAGSVFADFHDPDQPLDERVDDLICQLTLEEKVGQMEETCQPIPGLGIAGYSWWSECIHGVGRAGKATVFPVAIGLAATWDVDLMAQVANVISDEARAKHQEDPSARYHGLTEWAPSVDLARDPRWGRIEETYGEDPFLVSSMGMAMVRGLQGDDPKYLKVAATPKHFALHSQETDRQSRSFDVSERLLHEYYLAPFRACFVDAKAASVMTAYNGINGIPDTANRWLLTDLLRGQWGFDGAVVTDWGAPHHLYGEFHFVASDEDAVAAALRAGVDVLCQYDNCEIHGMRASILAAVRLGIVTEAELDTALRHSLKLRFRLGMFDPIERVPYEKITPDCLSAPDHVDLALQASRESIVLLKNARVPGRNNPTPLLPLDRRQLESIAVIGSHANRIFLGNYSGTPATPAVTTYEGVTNHVSDQMIVRQVSWIDIDHKKKKSPPVSADDQKRSIEAAVQAARDSDVAIVVLGLGPEIEHEGRDKQNLDLPRSDQAFIEKVVAANPATVVVLINGSPLAINWIQAHVPAIVEAWYPGEQGGNAIADVLFGDYNPAGRLPITFYAGLEQLPDLDNYDITLGRTYLYLRDPPLYPFGYGLSYTSFEYRNLHLEGRAPSRPPSEIGHDGAWPSTIAGTNDVLTAALDITNTGARDGDEVVQLYVRTLDAPVIMPFRQLRAFQRISLARGATRTVTLSFKPADLAYWDERRHDFVVAPGRYEVEVGASSADIRARAELTLP